MSNINMNYLLNLMNYKNNEITIKLKPSKKFLTREIQICILEDEENKPYVMKKNTLIKKVEYIPNKIDNNNSNDDNNLYEYVIYSGKNDITPNEKEDEKFVIDKNKKEKEINIINEKDNYVILKLKNFINLKENVEDFKKLIKIDFDIIITYELNNINRSIIPKSVKLNTYIYDKAEPIIDNNELLKDKKDIGICFSGGGIRTFGATIGIMRGLLNFDGKGNNILKDIKYVSSISGSTWVLVPYTFMNKKYTDDEFLGNNKFGDLNIKMNKEMYEYDDSKYLINGLTTYANNIDIIKYIAEGFGYFSYEEYSRIWSYVLGRIFLEPNNIMNSLLIAPDNGIEKIFQNDPLNVKEEYKKPYNKDRPFIITSTNTVDPIRKGSLINTDFNLIEMTPFYSGTLNSIKIYENEYGKSLTNSYSFHPISIDVKAISKVEINSFDYIQDRFNIFDMMGSSSAAYGIVAEKIGLGLENTTPHYRLYNKENNDMKYFGCVDGGVLDNAGILPLLQRKSKNIIMFANGCTKLNVTSRDNLIKSIPTMIRQLFLGNVGLNTETYFGYFEYINKLKVFKNEKNKDWDNFLDQLSYNIINNDTAFVELNDVETLESEKYSIPKYTIKKLLVIYLYQSKDWTKNRITKDVRKLLKTYEYSNFPYYSAIFENRSWYEAELMEMPADKLNLIADLTHWNLIKNKKVHESIKNLMEEEGTSSPPRTP